MMLQAEAGSSSVMYVSFLQMVIHVLIHLSRYHHATIFVTKGQLLQVSCPPAWLSFHNVYYFTEALPISPFFEHHYRHWNQSGTCILLALPSHWVQIVSLIVETCPPAP